MKCQSINLLLKHFSTENWVGKRKKERREKSLSYTILTTYLSIYWKKSSFSFSEYAEAAKIIKDRNFPCKLAKVDATEQKITAGKFDVKGYPTLKFFKSGKPMKYDGPRDAHVRFRAQSFTSLMAYLH